MQLYSGSTADFLRHEAQREVVERLNVSFLDYYHHNAPISEQRSWQYSLHALSTQIKRSALTEHGIILEMQLPLTSRRLDCMLTGINERRAEAAVIIELKQWSDAGYVEDEECVSVDYGPGRSKVQPHPSYQAQSYADYLSDNKAVFHESPVVDLTACSWLHNFQRNDQSPLLDSSKFGAILQKTPLFSADDSDALGTYLNSCVGQGKGLATLDRIVASRFAPSKKLMEHTAAMIKGEPVYVLLDEQRVAYQRIFTAARKAAKRANDRTIVLINGGPGTGKSVIAVNAMADLLRAGFKVQHATGSKAFTENLRKVLGPRAAASFRYFNSFMDCDAGDIDVLICDEAHRIRESSNNRFTSAARRSSDSQIDELVRAAKVTVFMIDDKQVVRPGEVGSSEIIREAAVRFDTHFVQENLEAQFRCAGSDEYIDWIDGLLGLRSTDTGELDPSAGFDFKLFASPEALESAIRVEAAKGLSARMTAGFCWKWSKPKDARLVEDVVIGAFRRPWNAQPDATGLPKQIPKANFWATDPNGIDQVGCVYTAQGFEFDYAGVIWGPDLVYRESKGGWIGDRSASHDGVVKRAAPDHFVNLVKNTYRVLLTRGMRGCYVHIMDDETRAYIQSLLVHGPPASAVKE